jgi:integrase
MNPAPMVRTQTPGIFKRGSRYVVVYRVNGKQRRESVRTMAEARRLKSARATDVARGEFFEASQQRFDEYAREWIERYQGKGRGFRDSTRTNYRSALERFAYPQLGSLKLAEITPRDISNYVAFLCDEKRVGSKLSDSSVRNALNPVRACLGTAVSEGLIRHSPAQGAVLPHRPDVDKLDHEEVRAFTRAQLAAFFTICPDQHATMFRVMVATGMRISEVLALQWKHLQLDGSSPHVKIRRASVRGVIGPPKSRHGRRDIPLSSAMVDELRARRSTADDSTEDGLVFPSLAGTLNSDSNLRRRTLQPLVEEVGAGWASFHTFRHTCASMLFKRGANAKQVQRWLGHHSASFTLDTYIHLLDDGLGAPLDVEAELNARGGNKVTTSSTESGRNLDAELEEVLRA